MRHAVAALPYSICAAALFVGYLVAIALIGRRWSPAGRGVALGFAVLFQAAALLSPWMLSTDLYSYVAYGRIFGVYHGNPYLEVPAQYPGDPFFEHVYWKFVPSFYGPLWTLVSGEIARLVGEDVAIAALAFRGLAALCALAIVAIVAALGERLDRRHALAGTVMVGWNPLLVVEAGLSGHNDLLMALLVVLALGLAVWRRPALAVGALVLGGLVKFVALALVPLLGLYLLRRQRGWRDRTWFVLRTSALASLLAVAVIAPVWAGPATFAVGTLGAGGDRYVNGLGELALGELRVWLGESREDTEVPLQFTGWWVATHLSASMRAAPGDNKPPLGELSQWTELLVVGPERDGWLRVYDPWTREVGYVRSDALGPAERPREYDDDVEVLAREQGPEGSPVLQEANRIVRLVGWGGFGLVWLGALAFGTGSFGGLVRGWLAALLALYYLASAWFWPWYVVWGVAAAALAPTSWLSRWAVMLSLGVLLLYAVLGFGETERWYLQTYRSLGVFGLPVVVMLADTAARLLMAGVHVVTSRGRERAIGTRGAMEAAGAARAGHSEAREVT